MREQQVVRVGLTWLPGTVGPPNAYGWLSRNSPTQPEEMQFRRQIAWFCRRGFCSSHLKLCQHLQQEIMACTAG